MPINSRTSRPFSTTSFPHTISPSARGPPSLSDYQYQIEHRASSEHPLDSTLAARCAAPLPLPPSSPPTARLISEFPLPHSPEPRAWGLPRWVARTVASTVPVPHPPAVPDWDPCPKPPRPLKPGPSLRFDPPFPARKSRAAPPYTSKAARPRDPRNRTAALASTVATTTPEYPHSSTLAAPSVALSPRPKDSPSLARLLPTAPCDTFSFEPRGSGPRQRVARYTAPTPLIAANPPGDPQHPVCHRGPPTAPHTPQAPPYQHGLSRGRGERCPSEWCTAPPPLPRRVTRIGRPPLQLRPHPCPA
jgi:hypothetical protein